MLVAREVARPGSRRRCPPSPGLRPIAGALTLLLLAAPAFAAPPDDEHGEAARYDALIEGALVARTAGRLEESLALLREAFALEPTPGLRHNIARLLEELGRYREAIDEYGAVVGHARVDPALKARDEAAIARLAPRLSSAWITIVAAGAPGGAAPLLDGGAVTPGAEHRAIPGAHVVEHAGPEREVQLLHFDARPGVRTWVRTGTAAGTPAFIDLAGVQHRIVRLAIDGYSVRTPPAELERVRVGPGHRRIVIEVSDGTGMDAAVELRPGERFAVAGWLPRSGDGALAVGPLALGGAGALVAAGGAALLALASSDRSVIEGAARDEQGRVVGITLAEADDLESRAAIEQGLGFALTAAGVAAAGAALVWWLTAE